MRLIYRVDDRFIHGQVIEGWVNYYRIPRLIVVNDDIASDVCKCMIYESILPPFTELIILSVDDFIKAKPSLGIDPEDTLIIVGSIDDLYKIDAGKDEKAYINIGCIAMGERDFEISDTVYLSADEVDVLYGISEEHEVYAHKLPWEKPINVRTFLHKIRDEE